MTIHSMQTHTPPEGLMPPQQVPGALATATQVIAAVWVVAAVGRAVVAPLAARGLTNPGAGTDVVFAITSGLASLVMLIQILALVVAGLWMCLFAEAARRLNREARHERPAYWGFLGWIVPIVNLWFPYQVVRDSAAAVGAGTRLVAWWWAGWLVTGVLMSVEGIALVAAAGDATAWVVASTLLALMTVATGAVWIRIVGSMTAGARQLAMGGRDGDPSGR